jgi:SAM-dependent methyltransferase
MEYYRKNANKYVQETVSVDMSGLYRSFLELIPKHSRILDLGCGSGRDTKKFIELGYDVLAIDPIEEFVEFSSKYTGQKTLLMKAEDIEFEDDFEGIWACASILHIEPENMPMVLRKLYKALRKNGVLFISVKHGEFEGERNRRYFCDYSEEKFESLGYYKIGFKKIEITYTNDMREGREGEKWLNIYMRKKGR